MHCATDQDSRVGCQVNCESLSGATRASASMARRSNCARKRSISGVSPNGPEAVIDQRSYPSAFPPFSQLRWANSAESADSDSIFNAVEIIDQLPTLPAAQPCPLTSSSINPTAITIY